MAINREDATKWLEEQGDKITTAKLKGILQSLQREHSKCTDPDSKDDIQGAIDVIEEAIFERSDEQLADNVTEAIPIQSSNAQWDPSPLVPLDSGVVHNKLTRKEKQAILMELRKSICNSAAPMQRSA